MEEENININILSSKSNNINQNLFLNNHKSVAFNHISNKFIKNSPEFIKHKKQKRISNGK